ncbi:MAG: OB-fold domain-containing protein, partial [Microthrixaceae bacterium]
SWSWVDSVREGQPLDTPHALAMIQLDGADTSMLNVIDAPSPDAVSTGARVRIRWADDRQGLLNDIACFELVEGS